MPQFILDYGNIEGRKAFNDLDSFTRGYITALFFTECEPGTTREDHNPETHSSLPGDVGFADLDSDTLETIKSDCYDFQNLAKDELDAAYAIEGDATYDSERAGHDFWLTRNGHGCGFWDRGLGELGDRLSTHAKAFGSRDAYMGDDGKVYVS